MTLVAKFFEADSDTSAVADASVFIQELVHLGNSADPDAERLKELRATVGDLLKSRVRLRRELLGPLMRPAIPWAASDIGDFDWVRSDSDRLVRCQLYGGFLNAVLEQVDRRGTLVCSYSVSIQLQYLMPGGDVLLRSEALALLNDRKTQLSTNARALSAAELALRALVPELAAAESDYF